MSTRLMVIFLDGFVSEVAKHSEDQDRCALVRLLLAGSLHSGGSEHLQKTSELLGFYLNQNPNFEPFMILHITSVCVSCLDIIPSGPLLTLCPLNKTEQLVGDQNLIQGSPSPDDLLSTTTTLIKEHAHEPPLFWGPLDVFSRQIFLLSHSCGSPLALKE